MEGIGYLAERIAFQYPQSDRRRCNPTCANCRTCWLPLSVSSIGSEAMQQIWRFSTVFSLTCFQYPQSDRRRCNSANLMRLAVKAYPFSILNRIGGDATRTFTRTSRRPPNTFSILNRIGGDATNGQVFLSPPEIAFQYPQSDRRRCNESPAEDRTNFQHLSVSSIGSEAMQRRVVFGRIVQLLSFSILNRIGGDATSSS